MPPEASSFPDKGSNFTDTSTSVKGPAGATITLNAFFVARWTSAFVPAGAPAMSSTTHSPLTVVQPSMPLASKSMRFIGTESGIFISIGAAWASTARPI
jgi:hypothetical protein